MTVQKTGPLVLLMFTVLCALPAAAVVGVIPSAFAQEEEDDDTNTQVAVPLTDQDQGAANLGANLAANVDVEHIIEETRPTPTPTEEEEPEFEAFCFVTENPLFGSSTLICFDTMEDCELGEELIDFVVDGQECKGFVTEPPDSGHCEILREQGQPPTFACILPPLPLP
jgi:hypothetical protein